MQHKIVGFLFLILLFGSTFLSALDVKIEEGKKVGSAIVLYGTSSESPSTNSVIAWWCSRAARLSGSSIFSMNLSAANATFSCLYSERDNERVADCTCEASGPAGSQEFDVERVWSENTAQGETLFVRASTENPVTSGEAGVFAGATQSQLQVGPSYDFDRWVFLFDFSSDSRAGRDYSLGQVVYNGSGYRMSDKGDWLKYVPRESSQPKREAQQQADGSPRTSGPRSTTKGGHIACQSKEWLDDMMDFVAQKDRASFDAYVHTNKCLVLKGGLRVSVTSRGLFTTEFAYEGLKFYTPKEAINY